MHHVDRDGCVSSGLYTLRVTSKLLIFRLLLYSRSEDVLRELKTTDDRNRRLPSGDSETKTKPSKNIINNPILGQRLVISKHLGLYPSQSFVSYYGSCQRATALLSKNM